MPSFTTPVLKEPMKISAEPIAQSGGLYHGTDRDFVVKVIDVYPDEVGPDPKMGGYQPMISVDILRGTLSRTLQRSEAYPRGRPGVPLRLLTVESGVLTVHRVMVQVQSSRFPLYDRNPQTYVPIFSS